MPKAGFDFDVQLDGADRVGEALRRAQPILREKTVPVMEKAAGDIARAAMFHARQHPGFNHPGGLWSPKGRVINPSYRTTKKGAYWFRVETPGTAAGRAEAVSEFARLATRPQGAALVRELDSLYGRPGGSGGGRILWAAADEQADKIAADVERAAEEAAAGIEREMGDA